MKKTISILLAVLIICNIGIAVLAAPTEANTFYVEADKTSVSVGDTVTVYVYSNTELSNMMSVSALVDYDEDVFTLDTTNSSVPFTGSEARRWGIVDTTNELGQGKYTGASMYDADSETTVPNGLIATLVFTANTEAEASAFEVFYVDGSWMDWDTNQLNNISDTLAMGDAVTVDVTAAPEFTGYAAAISGDAEISAGEDAKVSVSFTNSDSAVTAYNAYDLTFTYDTDKLTYKEAATADDTAEITEKDGTIRVKGYGDDKTLETAAVTLTFTGKAAGDAEVKLTGAKADISANAIEDDVLDAYIAEDTAVITVSGYTVTLSAGLSGAATAAPNTDYVFTATDYANYTYAVTATVNGQPVEVSDVNGTFTIPAASVTGNISISAVMTPKTYTVTVNGDDVTAAETAVYNTAYTFTINKQEGYTYAVAVSVGGNAYTSFAVSGNSYTIPGTDIKGDIIITVTKTALPADSVTVTVNGPEGEVEFAANAVKGTDYTFTVKPAEGYTYEVSAKIGETDVTVTPGENNTYTIAGVDITGDIVITVTKTSGVEVAVSDYLTLDDSKIYLVTAKGEIPDGSIALYDGQSMYWSDKYEAYAYLVVGVSLDTDAAAKLVTIAQGEAAGTVVYTGDTNGTGNIDVNDAQLVYDLYNVKYSSFEQVSMQKFLNSDVNGNGTISILDAAAIVAAIQ